MNGIPPPRAVVFDLDGVVTFTARVHFAAWKELFDGYLREVARDTATAFRPFTEEEYRSHVDGRPRYEGVRAFLASRGLALPEGGDGDPARRTVHGLGDEKNRLFRERLRDGVDVDPESVRLVGELRAAGVATGVASSSRNAAATLDAAGLGGLFQARVDGVTSQRLGLRGKPHPDIFLACLEALDGPPPAEAAVVEDAVAGVAAGRAGGFGLVIGVDRGGQEAALREAGAHRVTPGLGGVTLQRLRSWFDRMPASDGADR